MEELTALILELTNVLETTKTTQIETEALAAQVLEGGPVFSDALTAPTQDELELTRQCLDERAKAQEAHNIRSDAVDLCDESIKVLTQMKLATAAIAGQRESAAETVHALYRKRMDTIASEHESITDINKMLAKQLKHRHDLLLRIQSGLARIDNGLSATPSTAPSKSVSMTSSEIGLSTAEHLLGDSETKSE